MQAPKGGTTGVNGEFYEGGQFLPNSADTVKGENKPTIGKGKRSEVSPYVWQPSPAADMLSIFDRIQHDAYSNKEECTYVKGQGLVGFRFTGVHEYQLISVHPGRIDMPEDRRVFVARMIERFNAGERWFPLTEDPFHYRNDHRRKTDESDLW